jgi:hypothetical protein
MSLISVKTVTTVSIPFALDSAKMDNHMITDDYEIDQVNAVTTIHTEYSVGSVYYQIKEVISEMMNETNNERDKNYLNRLNSELAQLCRGNYD